MRLHVCTGCRKEKMLDERVRYWCQCNPSAKFFFIVKSDREFISAFVGATQQVTKGIRPAKKALSKPKRLSTQKGL